MPRHKTTAPKPKTKPIAKAKPKAKPTQRKTRTAKTSGMQDETRQILTAAAGLVTELTRFVASATTLNRDRALSTHDGIRTEIERGNGTRHEERIDA